MNTLDRVERYRQALIKELLTLDGLGIDDIEVEVTITPSPENESKFLEEAAALDWHPESHDESKWFTSERPSTGATSVFRRIEEQA